MARDFAAGLELVVVERRRSSSADKPGSLRLSFLVSLALLAWTSCLLTSVPSAQICALDPPPRFRTAARPSHAASRLHLVSQEGWQDDWCEEAVQVGECILPDLCTQGADPR